MSTAPISAIVRSTSGFDRLLLRTITEMGAALVDVIRHPPMLAQNSPASKKQRKSEVRQSMAVTRLPAAIS